MSTSTVVKPGDVIAERYRVDRILGKGGMGVVVAATHLELLEPRAIKVMLPHVAETPDHAKRFLREARIAARLKSEHAAKVFDMGRLPDGSPFMVMEYLEGEDLASLAKREITLTHVEAVLYVLQALDALAEAHALKLVHRDIKHANLFLTHGLGGAPIIKVLDFGISKADAVDDAITATGEMMGTPLYMAPEQMRADRDIDARADIWSLGVLLYWLLTRRYPFEATSTLALVTLVARGDPPLPPSAHRADIPRALDEIILRCLEQDRDRRPATAVELARALGPFVPGSEPLVTCIEHRSDARSSITNEHSMSFSSMQLVSLQVAPTASLHAGHPLALFQAAPPSAPLQALPSSGAPTLPANAEKTGGQWQTSTQPGQTGANRRIAWLIAVPFGATLLIGVVVLLVLQSPSNPAATVSSEVQPSATPSTTAAVVVPATQSTAPPLATSAVSKAPAATTSVRAKPAKQKVASPNNVSDRHTF